MAKHPPIDEIDLAIDEILSLPERNAGEARPRLASLVRVAADLRGMPSETFKTRLRNEMQRRTAVATKTEAVSYIRKGFHTITPYLSAVRGLEAVEFVKRAFGAQELFRAKGGAGGYHCELRIGDSMVMMGGGGEFKGPDRPANILLTVDDADATYRRAIEAGGTSLYEPVTQPFGDRDAGVRDAAGNNWFVTTRRESAHRPADQRDVVVGLNPPGSAKYIEFLKTVFDAEVVFRHDSPDGTVRHARVRIGDSIVMVSEPHGPWFAMLPGIYMYVPNVDELYKRAIAGGATSLYEPTDMPYGDRLGGVKDPFGVEWYISTHIRDAV